ncbi:MULTISPECIES: succinate dehydrogenase flavoprotein subunit [unclassified Thiomonas]|uniref:succinate dehydrogenase flavoprotein subunit n=1 Tax=unclassified Thiomonas TaxID=2625466 RepID=UPI0004DBA84C|nr:MULTISPECIES: succinate dehydrogenase flavoprotein subunit [unclassified Thiomonas]MDD5000969.1 succinate dehydrogenase flavoprotein subunit [Thiomonas arsenitoxydans]CDW93150.1 succinate dehydrogenase, flavoprotein subunit [Thiomonas sp. CB2]VDY06328.1 succinate dehydrogenase, flavoprotein subunit [Thiomonas sp. Bio17B3]VDY10376.1 succinate dehydrogenase, flavoprotein subunit [Thiomonas sp. Sup16B3]VDY14599.1 Succinate dehydrogenase flavoprotein subunit [Thiomonas sp. OC7]
MQVSNRKFDVVVVGAGGSGLRCALQLTRAGLDVAVLSKVFPTRSHTVAAQGGVSAALGNMSEDDWYWHMFDTVKGSDYLGDQDAIEFMCREANSAVYELEHFGMPFDRNPDGTIYQRPFGGHTANFGEKAVQRACAAADRTGHAMLHTLYQQNVEARTHFFVEWMALDLIRDAEGDVLGVVALEMETGDVTVFEGKATVLATGGAGRIFAASTNAFINTGDGLGMAARAGLPLQDMEFWQFHPTGVAGAGVLITEGVRGEGGILLNANGERFMERYAPTYKDLAPRDFVSRSMDQEIKEGRGAGPRKDHVLLKLDHLGAETIMKRLPSIREIAIRFANVDPIKEPIPVVPTIHYQMGGIPANIHSQVVVPQGDDPAAVVGGLYAIGECSCVSVHGANRLGTNSLLDLLVFGRSAGNHIVNSGIHQRSHKPLPKDAADRSLARLAQLDASKSGDGSHVVADAIRAAMQTHCGVFRNAKLMAEGVQAIADIAGQVDRIHLKDKSKVFNTARIEALEVDNLIEVAKATMVSAEARQESRGAHYHNDHTERDDQDWLKHTLWWREGSRLSYKPVKLKPLTVESFKPKARTF